MQLIPLIFIILAAWYLSLRVQRQRYEAIFNALELKHENKFTEFFERDKKYDDALQEYAKETMQYIGSYPSWKVIQEYRQLLIAMKKGDGGYEYHLHNIDHYLNKIVAAAEKLDSVYGGGFDYVGHRANLCDAKGDYMIPEIRQLYPEAKNWYEENR